MTSRIIGITGGIAMGKTTVSNRLETYYGLTILDADVYARNAVAIGTPILNAITRRYGPEILLPDQSLDRAKLGQIIFSQPDDRTWLNAQIHPEVRFRMQQDSDRLIQGNPVIQDHQQERSSLHSRQPVRFPVFWIVPLLFETSMTELVDEIWVIYCHREQQLQRLCDRSGLTQAEANLRIEAQLDIQVKCDAANVILDNSQSTDRLYQQIEQALRVHITR
ncbi:MAG: dephospho-CoA kinase [Cyanobacteria bacterium]|nr:dephospho-CoA kinase [Cyanobacteriota bacterium]